MTVPGSPAVTQLQQTAVDLGGLMTVLSKHLYSTPLVALRELIQNAHDAILRRRVEQPAWSEPARIDVIPDPARGQIRILDNGAGLTESEIHTDLATIGTGHTRQLRASGHDELGFIGMFGLGFLSAFVIAERVSLRTTSYQSPDRSWRYRSANALSYELSPTTNGPIGTEVTLDLKAEYRALATADRIEASIWHYCALLRAPIYIAGKPTPINDRAPPWRLPDTGQHWIQQRRQDLDFANRFARDGEPMATMPVRPRDNSDAIGLLWVHDRRSYASTDQRQLAVFVRGMLLDDDVRELLPPWAGFIGGVIESEKLTPTASREDLQRDAHFDNARAALVECLVEGLSRIAAEQREAWRRILLHHGEALLGASLCEARLFELLADRVSIPTLQGELRLPELLRQGSVHVMLERQPGFEAMLYRMLGVPVALGHRYGVLAFLRLATEKRHWRLIELGTEQGNRSVFRQTSLPAEDESWLRTHLCDGEQLIVARFEPERLPLVVVADRDFELKERLEKDQQDRKISTTALMLARKFASSLDAPQARKLYLNLSNPVLQALLVERAKRPEAAARALRLLRAFKTILSDAEGITPEQLSCAMDDLCDSLRRFIDVA
jgi:molecular chaperone HtpG